MLNRRVSYPDTDAAGVVNHGRYIDMAERARHDLLRVAGFSYASLSTTHDTLLVVHKIKRDCARQCRIDLAADGGIDFGTL